MSYRAAPIKWIAFLTVLISLSACTKTNDDLINEAVTYFSAKLPMTIGQGLTVISVGAGTANEIVYTIQAESIDPEKITDEIVSMAKNGIVDQIKADTSSEKKELTQMLKRDIKIKYSFVDKDNYEFMVFEISRNDFGI